MIGLDSEESLGSINFEEMKNCRIEIIIIVIISSILTEITRMRIVQSREA